MGEMLDLLFGSLGGGEAFFNSNVGHHPRFFSVNIKQAAKGNLPRNGRE